jgi:hypothetical protein
VNQGADRVDLLRELWDETLRIGNRLVDIPTLLVALALTIGGAVAVLLIPAQNAVAVVICGAALLACGISWSMWRLSIARRDLAAVVDLYRRHDSVPADPTATRDLPPPMLRPDDATDLAHLDRILARNPADWPEPGPSVRRLTLASRILVAVMLVGVAVVAAGSIALVTSTLSLVTDAALAARGALAFAVAFPAIAMSRISGSVRDMALVDEAAQWDRAQLILDNGALPDDGSDLRMIHRGAKPQIDARRASYVMRPRARHVAAARRGVVLTRVTGLLPWLILGPVGVALATFAAARG